MESRLSYIRKLAAENYGGHVLNEAVNPDRTRSKPRQAADRVLRLTPAIRAAAAEVVKAYDAFDLDALEKDELDVVFLQFTTPGGLERADDLGHRFPGMDSELLSQCRRCLHSIFKPLREHVEALEASLQQPASGLQQDAGFSSLT